MHLDRIEVTLRLTNTAPLSIGTGRLEPRTAANGANEPEGSVMVIHTGKGGPCIPASTLKGALRARFADVEAAKTLFGNISDGEHGNAGQLHIYAALMQDQSQMRPPIRQRGGGNGATFERPATAIDRRAGSVSAHKLFTLKAVPAGGVFAAEVILHGAFPPQGGAAEGLETLAKALAPLHDGVAVGKGGRLGGGVLRLDEVAKAKLIRFDPATGFVEEPDLEQHLSDCIAAAAVNARPGAPAAQLEFSIHTTSPFLISDPELLDGAGRTRDSDQLAALVDGAGKPVLWASSLLGALRSRAAWLAELDRLRRGKPGFVPSTRHADHPADDRDLDEVLLPARAVRVKADLEKLSSVERLFGVAGWKGLLAIVSLERAVEGTETRITSVAIDRLSGGGLDSALFTTLAFTGVKWKVALAIETRGTWHTATMLAADMGLLKALAQDIRDNGLMLGHAAARGFGWCDVGGMTLNGAAS